MSEWLTTGEMIDRLKVGEIAEAYDENGEKLFRVQRTSEYHRPFKNLDNWNNELILNEPSLKYKWRIVPRYVSFEEAMKALMNGKTVWLWVNDNKAGYYIDKESGKLWAIVGDCTAPVEKIYFGDKWTIDE
jgi:hypothetical protein